MMHTRSLVAIGLAVAAAAVGFVVWVSGNGAAIIVGVAVIVGIALCAGRLGYPAATAVIVIWSLATWTFTGEMVRFGPASATAWNWVFLAAGFAPILVGLVVRVVFEDGAASLVREMRLRPELLVGALSGAFAMAAAVSIAYKRYGLNGMAWAMSGDARNTIQSTFEMFPPVTGGQGLIVDPTMTLYSTLAVFGSRPESTFTSGGALMDHAILMLSTFELGVIALITAASAGLLVQVVGAQRVPLVAVIGASLAPLFGIGIGIGLQDGFVSALLAIAIVTLSLTLAALAVARDCPPGLRFLVTLTIAIALALLLFTWAYAIVAVVPSLAFVVVWSWRSWLPWMRLVIVVGGIVAGLGLASFMPRWIHHTINNNVFAMTGTIVSPNPWLLVVVPIFFGLGAMWFREREARRVFGLMFAAGIAVAGAVVIICYAPAGAPGFPYYAAKLTWIWLASILGLLFVPVAAAFGTRKCVLARLGGFGRSLRRVGITASTVGACLLTILVLFGVRFASPLESPVLAAQPLPFDYWSPISRGWVNPASGAVGVARRAAEFDNAVVFGVTDPGNDRLVNFWLDLIPSNQGADFKGWAYYTASDLASLCDLLTRDPTRTVVTVNPAIAKSIESGCHIENPKIRLLN